MALTSDEVHVCQAECTASVHFDQHVEPADVVDQRSQAELVGLYKYDYSLRGWHVTRVVETAAARTIGGTGVGVYFVARFAGSSE